MKIFALNICPDGSTGHIMRNIAETTRRHGYEYLTVSAPKNYCVEDTHYYLGFNILRKINILIGKLISNEFVLSYFSTKKFIKILKKENPDIIHFHNLHAYYINLPYLVKYITKVNKPVVWTLHDCWAFTGHCAYFTMKKCDKWKTKCTNCPAYKEYPVSLFDRSTYKFEKKKKLFTSINSLTLVTPSQWLADLIKSSFLKECKVEVINNGIDLSVFKPTESDLKARFNLENKYVILGVASPWSERKGFDVFVELSKKFDDSYKIILVGLNDEQIETLPDNIIGIRRTSNQIELAQYYTMSDVFVNPTREDNFPTVNIEALACGTPVVTFDTGGSPEIIDNSCGSVVKCDDIDSLERELRHVCENKPYSHDDCINRSKLYDMNCKFEEYMLLYNQYIEENML